VSKSAQPTTRSGPRLRPGPKPTLREPLLWSGWLEADTVERADLYGAAHGLSGRSAAVRELLEIGLRAVEAHHGQAAAGIKDNQGQR
jgi:hypothetical protein